MAQEGGPPRSGVETDELQHALREVLTLTSLARTTLARRLGLTVHDVEAMEHVMLAGEPIGPVELSRRVGVTSAAATQSVHRLEAAGHLRRVAHPGDRRRQVLEVTPAGAAHVFRELRPLLELTRQAGTGFTDHERAAITLYLSRTAEAYREFLR